MTTDAFPESYATFNVNWDDPEERIEIRTTHQVGHILGLYHEHQNPNSWDPNEGGFGPGHYFGFKCENLKGFEEATADLTNEEVRGRGGVCRSRTSAIQHGFHVAAHIPPMLELTYLPWYTEHPSPDDVDWLSVMLYSSSVGVQILRTWGLLRRKDYWNTGVRNSRIHGTVTPSQRDIDGILQLYAAVDSRFMLRYFHDPHSMYYAAFNDMRNFAACERDLQR